MRRFRVIILTAVGIIAAGIFASFQWTWWWHSEESFPDICRERCQFLTDAYFINGMSPTPHFFQKLSAEDQRSFADYMRFHCDTMQPESIRERAEWCLYASTIPILDPGRRTRSKAITEHVDWITSDVWRHITAGSRKVKALPFTEYVTLVHGLLPLSQGEDTPKLHKAIRECFDLMITHVGFFDRIDIVEALIDAIREKADQNKDDPERKTYQDKIAAQVGALAQGDGTYIITSASGIDYHAFFQKSGGLHWVRARKVNEPEATGSFTLGDFEDILTDGALEDHVQAPSELGLEQIKWLRADAVAFPEEHESTASLCIVADTGGKIVGETLAVRLLRASGLKDYHGTHVINLPPVIGKTDPKRLHQLVANTVEAHDQLTHIHLDLVAHGDEEGIQLSEFPIVAEDFVRLAEEFPRITFLITTLACRSGDQAVALERLLQERAEEELTNRLTLITRSSAGALTLQASYGGYYALCFLQSLHTGTSDYGRAASLAAKAVQYANTPLIVHRGKLYRL